MKEILEIIEICSDKVFVIGFISFLLTYLIKMPIKKATAKFNDEKRKMINIFIIFIPMILSFLITIFHTGIYFKNPISALVLSDALKSWIASLCFYSIISRIWIIIKGVSTKEIDSKKAEELIEDIKEDIADMSAQINSENNLSFIIDNFEKAIDSENLSDKKQNDFDKSNNSTNKKDVSDKNEIVNKK